MKGRTLALSLVGAFACAGPAFADKGCESAWPDGAAKLTVQVAGATPVKGEVAITVYADDKAKFLAPGAKLLRVRTPTASPTTACFWLPPATYEVAVYHDVNADHE